jgi:4'-phosphopantetheinyl transferase
MSDRAIYLYLGLFDEIDRQHVRDACIASLSADERERAGRFVHERHRRQFQLAHGLVRAALSLHAPEVDPQAWRFLANRFGRPTIAGPFVGALHFSLSHTEGCVACAISPSEFVGVDVEAIDRLCPHFAIADFAFSARENAELRALPPSEGINRFFDYWTLKEAYVKARGMGLRLPLDQFTMLVKSRQEIAITFAPDFGDDSGRWCFTLTSPTSRLRLAVADGSGEGRGLPVISRPWPLP